jgi:V8-like Glu-specific endopeptidase
MAAPGHRPVSSDDSAEESQPILEAAVPLTNRVSVHYYQPPAPPPRITNESSVFAVLGPPAAAEVALPDVAVASFGQTDVLEAIIGNDDRVKVAKPLLSTNPWRQICSLRIKSKSGMVYAGTAWFIGPKTLATAGHCVYMLNDGGWAASIEITPAQYGDSAPFGKIKATKFSAVDGWTVQNLRDFDYGVIHLASREVGEKIGNFAVESFPDALLANVVAKVSGYPADREQAKFQYFHERPIMSLTPTRITYDIDTFGGQSGSPIWEDTAEHGVVAIGIHTNGGISSNSGTRVNDEVIDNLISWLED